MEPKQKQHPVVDVTTVGSKVQCCEEQYCIGTWNVRSMNQGKLEAVKQEMARVNINILGISKLKWTGVGEFNSDEHYIYYCGQESLRRNGVAIIVNKRVQNAALGCNLKNDRMISVRFQGKPFSITVIHVYAPISNAEDSSYVSKEISSSICILCAFWLVFFGPTLKHHPTPSTSSDLRGFWGLSGSTSAVPEAATRGRTVLPATVLPFLFGPVVSICQQDFVNQK